MTQQFLIIPPFYIFTPMEFAPFLFTYAPDKALGYKPEGRGFEAR
jgi:hypothetical protein